MSLEHLHCVCSDGTVLAVHKLYACNRPPLVLLHANGCGIAWIDRRKVHYIVNLLEASLDASHDTLLMLSQSPLLIQATCALTKMQWALSSHSCRYPNYLFPVRTNYEYHSSVQVLRVLLQRNGAQPQRERRLTH
jgi:hypothetical protein